MSHERYVLSPSPSITLTKSGLDGCVDGACERTMKVVQEHSMAMLLGTCWLTISTHEQGVCGFRVGESDTAFLLRELHQLRRGRFGKGQEIRRCCTMCGVRIERKHHQNFYIISQEPFR